MSKTPTQPRPSWVWLAIGRASTRRAALSHLTILGLNLSLFLGITGVESASQTVLGKIALALGLAGTVFGVISMLWVWLAVRWVDRNGQWA